MKRIIKFLFVLLFMLLCFGCQSSKDRRKVFFGYYAVITHEDPQMIELKRTDRERILKALDNTHMEIMTDPSHENNYIGGFSDLEYYCLLIEDGQEKKKIRIYSFPFLAGRIMVNNERYFADLYDELFGLLREINNNNGILKYDYYEGLFAENADAPYRINQYVYPLYDCNSYFYEDKDPYYEVCTYYSYLVDGNAPMEEVADYFEINIDSDQSLKEWYLLNCHSEIILSSEIVIENVGIKLFQIGDNDQYIFIVKDLSQTECVRMSLPDWMAWCYN